MYSHHIKIFSVSYLLDIFLVFSFIFCYSLPIVKNSVYFLCPFLLFLVFLSKRRTSIFKGYFYSKYYFRQLFLLLVIIAFSLVITLLHQASDFSIIPSFINLGIMSFIALLLIVYFLDREYDPKEFLFLIILSFVIQSIIQMLSFLIPDFRELVRLTYTDEMIKKAQGYSNMRGLALTDSVFFSLSVIYGLIFLFYMRYIEYKIKNITLLDIFLFVLLFMGALFSGRSFFVGLIFACLFFVSLKNVKNAEKISFVLNIIFTMLTTAFLIYILLPVEYREFINNIFFRYVFEFLYSFADSGKFETTSSDHLLNDMYYVLPLSTYIFGDGYYTSPFGGYYGSTDSGYMRNVLFFGIGGLFLLLLFQISILIGFSKKYSFDKIKFPLFLLAFILVMHIKGETLGFLQSLQRLLMIYCYYFYFLYYKTKYKASIYGFS